MSAKSSAWKNEAINKMVDRHIDVADDAKLLWAHGSTMAL